MATSRVVVLPIDDSEHSARAFDWFAKYGYREGDKVIIVHFHVPPPLPAMSLYHCNASLDAAVKLTEEYKETVDASIQKARELMDRYKELAKTQGMSIKEVLHSAEDGIGESIIKLAEAKHANFIVIGSRGLSRVRRTILGSVSEYVVNHSRMAVTVVPPPSPINPF